MNINITDPIFHDEAKALAHLESGSLARWRADLPALWLDPASPHGRQNPGRNVPLQ